MTSNIMSLSPTYLSQYLSIPSSFFMCFCVSVGGWFSFLLLCFHTFFIRRPFEKKCSLFEPPESHPLSNFCSLPSTPIWILSWADLQLTWAFNYFDAGSRLSYNCAERSIQKDFERELVSWSTLTSNFNRTLPKDHQGVILTYLAKPSIKPCAAHLCLIPSPKWLRIQNNS